MKDKMSEGLLIFSAFDTIVVMILLIIKERRKQRIIDKEQTKSYIKRKTHYKSETLYLD